MIDNLFNDDIFDNNEDIESSVELENKIDFNNMFIDLGLPSGTLWCSNNILLNEDKSNDKMKNNHGSYFDFPNADNYLAEHPTYSLPTWKQFKELYECCKIEETYYDEPEIFRRHVRGLVTFIGPNGNSIDMYFGEECKGESIYLLSTEKDDNKYYISYDIGYFCYGSTEFKYIIYMQGYTYANLRMLIGSIRPVKNKK